MSNLITIAAAEIGTREISGSKHNEKITNYAKEAGFSTIKDDETPWCSIFMNWVAKKAKLETSNLATARSWLNVGIPVTEPEPGDVVIFWRENLVSYKGHVGIFMGYSFPGNRIYCLGGNQSDMVSITAYTVDQLLGFRRLRSISVSMPKTNLTEGDTGHEVIKLQDLLKQLGFNCGTSDGIFGPKTKKTLQQFQSTSPNLEITGVFNARTKNAMSDILKSRI